MFIFCLCGIFSTLLVIVWIAGISKGICVTFKKIIENKEFKYSGQKYKVVIFKEVKKSKWSKK